MKVVFVGCGGTFWCASPMMAALVRRYMPERCYFVDPDVLEERNLERQWVTSKTHQLKARNACTAVLGPCYRAPVTGVQFQGMWADFVEKYRKELSGSDVVLVVNVDNDDARLQIREFCREHTGKAVMVMSGCDVAHGQVYTGWWEDGRPLNDWAVWHPDVVKDKPPADTCGQNIFSNAMTGVFLGAAFQTVCDALDQRVTPTTALEWYWKREDGDFRMRSWTDEIELGKVATKAAEAPQLEEVRA